MGKSSKTTRKSSEAVKKVIEKESPSSSSESVPKDVISEHLPPIGLVFTVLACSSILWVFAFRDVFATGRNIAGIYDEAMLVRI